MWPSLVYLTSFVCFVERLKSIAPDDNPHSNVELRIKAIGIRQVWFEHLKLFPSLMLMLGWPRTHLVKYWNKLPSHYRTVPVICISLILEQYRNHHYASQTWKLSEKDSFRQIRCWNTSEINNWSLECGNTTPVHCFQKIKTNQNSWFEFMKIRNSQENGSKKLGHNKLVVWLSPRKTLSPVWPLWH